MLAERGALIHTPCSMAALHFLLHGEVLSWLAVRTILDAAAVQDKKPVALSLKVDGTTYVHLSTLRTTQRQTKSREAAADFERISS